MFSADRVFSQRSTSIGSMEWFFDTREGLMGPFRTEDIARKALGNHVEYCRRHKLDGGRKLGVRQLRLELAAQ